MAAMRVGSMSHWQPAAAASSYTLRVTWHQRSHGIVVKQYSHFCDLVLYRHTRWWPTDLHPTLIQASAAGAKRGVTQPSVRRVSFVLMCSFGSQPISGMRASWGYLARMFPLMWLRGRGLRQPLSRGGRGLLTSLGLSWPRMWHGGHASLKGQT